MRRPFAHKRPYGPFFTSEDFDRFTDLDFDRESKKEVVGVHGTPFPNCEKEELLVIYILEGPHIPFTRDFAAAVSNKINSRPEFDGYRVEFLKSGKSSAKEFREQAVLVEVLGEDLAIRHSDIERIQGIIERERLGGTMDEDDAVTVKEIVYELKGKPC